MTIRRRLNARRCYRTALPLLLVALGLGAGTGHGTCHDDVDGDGMPDPYDNCLEVANASQIDTDLDGLGNACDADFDNSGVVDGLDFGRFVAAFGTTEPTADLDGDGLVGGADFGRFVALFGSTPGPSGLACVTGPAGGLVPCEFEAYDEIVETLTVNTTQVSPGETPDLGEEVVPDELFVGQEVGLEVLTAADSVDFSSDGVYSDAGPFTPVSFAVGAEITRWTFNAHSGDASLASVIAAEVEFAPTEEVLGVKLTGLGDLAVDATDRIEIAGQTIKVDVPTLGGRFEVFTRCGGGASSGTGVSFSIDQASAQIGFAASFPAGAALEPGDVLTVGSPGAPGPNPPTAATPIPAPGEMIDTVALTGFAAAEVDALSYGKDRGKLLWFSVDERSRGVTGAAPDVRSEGRAGSNEAAADVFEWNGALAGGPGAGLIGNTALYDGNGVAPFGGEGFGLDETIAVLLNQYRGDDLDAFDGDTTPDDVAGRIFFSLDSATAAGLGGTGGTIFTRDSDQGEITTWSYDSWLGLQAGDDIDALAVRDVDPITPTLDPAVDQVLFSLRRGSASLGLMACNVALPIEPGDVLSLPCPGAATPAIVVPAGDLGLQAVRDGFVAPDELDALDRLPTSPLPRDPNPVGGDPDPNPGG